MKIAFYNVENLFDTLDDPYINDNAFLPESGLKWNQKRYVLKLQRIARVIKAIEEPMPLVIGLAEVENRKVLKDLVSAMGLTEKEVGIVHENSPDERGIDVGFLYRKDLISRTEHSSHTVTFQDDLSDRTRDILHVKAFLNNAQVIHFFINHWPSRKDGVQQSLSKRIAAAEALRYQVQTVMDSEPDAKIVVMGDFNCDPGSAPVRRILDKEETETGLLYNQGWKTHRDGSGSMMYRGKWFLFDQILISDGFLSSQKGLKFIPDSFTVFSREWMLFYNPKYGDRRPNKTYGGRKYHGGFSDHLPVYICVDYDNF